MNRIPQDSRLERINNTELVLNNQRNMPTRIFAGAAVPLENSGIDELQDLLRTQETVDRLLDLAPDFFNEGDEPRVCEMGLSPDFYKGEGIPIGTIIATQAWIIAGDTFSCLG